MTKPLKIILITGFGLAALYFVVRPFTGYMLAKALMGGGGESKQTLGRLDTIRSSLRIYYSDMEGKYPASLEVLSEGGRYMPAGDMPKADIFGKTKDDDFTHLHKGSGTQVKLFRSPDDADDSGGWGYVADPASPDYGKVFVNCTHMYMGKGSGTPWNKL